MDVVPLGSAFEHAQIKSQGVAHEQQLENRLLGAKEKQSACDAVSEQQIADFISLSPKKLRLIQERYEIERK
jgi:hypothetical protein